MLINKLDNVEVNISNGHKYAIRDIAKGENVNRSEFVREAMKMYLREKKKQSVAEQMKNGYQEMADINLNIAKMCFDAEEQAFSAYEEKLAECE